MAGNRGAEGGPGCPPTSRSRSWESNRESCEPALREGPRPRPRRSPPRPARSPVTHLGRRLTAFHAGAQRSRAREVPATRSLHPGCRGGPGAPPASGEREVAGRGPTAKDNPGGSWGGWQPQSQGAEGGGVGKQQRAWPPRRRRARSSPSRSPQSNRGPGPPRVGSARPPAAPPPAPPPRPRGRRGGGRRLRVPLPRAPPPPGLPAAAIPTLLRLPQLPVAHGLGGGRGPGERRPGARPRRAPLGGRRRKLREAAAAAAGPFGLFAPSQPFSRPLPSHRDRRLGFVRGDGVAPWPPQEAAGHQSPVSLPHPRPWRTDPPWTRRLPRLPAAGEASAPPAPWGEGRAGRAGRGPGGPLCRGSRDPAVLGPRLPFPARLSGLRAPLPLPLLSLLISLSFSWPSPTPSYCGGRVSFPWSPIFPPTLVFRPGFPFPNSIRSRLPPTPSLGQPNRGDGEGFEKRGVRVAREQVFSRGSVQIPCTSRARLSCLREKGGKVWEIWNLCGCKALR